MQSEKSTQKLRRPYQPPRLILPSEADTAPEGKTFARTLETTFSGAS